MEIKKYSKDDLSGHLDEFCELFHKVYTAPADREIISQRYLDNPYGDLCMYVALEGNRIVANYSVVPINVLINGRPCRAALSLNTMTDPEYEGRGLFTTLASGLYNDLEKSGYAMVIGFPNFMANRIFNSRLGWKTVLEIPTLKLSLNDIDPPGGEELKEGFFEGMTFSGDADFCNAEMSPEYINWRFKNNREKNYKVLSIDSSNWIIYQPYNNEINLTKLSATDISNAKRLIEAVASAGKAGGYESLTAWSRINSGVHDLMEKTGFRVASPIRTFGLRCFDASVFETVSDPRKWSLQMGDCNIY